MDYDEQLERALDRTPDIESEETRFEIPDPEVRQEGNVTVYENFRQTVDRLGRDPNGVVRFLQDELGTSGHIDESGRARLTGSFDGDRLTEAVDEYADRYVICSECRLPDTRLEREGSATLLRCEACGARSAT